LCKDSRLHYSYLPDEKGELFMRRVLPVLVLLLLLAACGNATTGSSAQQPTAMAEKPTEAAMAEKPTEAAMAEKPTEAAMAEKPTEAAMAEKPTEAAMAEAHKVPLQYVDGLSNAGPKDATGTLTLLSDKNSIILDVKGLPPIPGKVFEVWLLPAAVSGGRFNTASDGTGHPEQTATGDLKDYNQIVLTIEPEPDDSPKPADQHSIGSGKF
jgi:hypothetical protein